MTQKEETEALGQLVIDHRAIKQRMVALEQQIQRAGYKLIELGNKFLPTTPGRFADVKIEDYKEILDIERIGDLIEAHRATMKRMNEIEDGLKQLE